MTMFSTPQSSCSCSSVTSSQEILRLISQSPVPWDTTPSSSQPISLGWMMHTLTAHCSLALDFPFLKCMYYFCPTQGFAGDISVMRCKICPFFIQHCTVCHVQRLWGILTSERKILELSLSFCPRSSTFRQQQHKAGAILMSTSSTKREKPIFLPL